MTFAFQIAGIRFAKFPWSLMYTEGFQWPPFHCRKLLLAPYPALILTGPLLQNVGSHVPPVPPRFQHLSVRRFFWDLSVQSWLSRFLTKVEAFGEVSLDPIDHQQKPMTWKEKTRFLTFRVPIAERMTDKSIFTPRGDLYL